MATLVRDLRKNLERTVKQARRVAEVGARKVLEQLGVDYHEPYGSMTPEQRALRNRLRAHGRQLGDRRDHQKGTQTIDRLIQECAYEHWHRMLFARFLAETDLLIEPQSGVAITLEECQELAREQGTDWLELASDYAERMLPQIFRADDPVLAVTLPPETRSELEDLLKALPRDVFNADDSLGWVYQFWQAEKKEEVNRSGSKIGADELPAVTQLFTEDYMVLFLLHNTLGAWWAGKVLAENPDLATSARNEDELRTACKVGDVDWSYLRFARDKSEGGDEGPWCPVAGKFDGWPKASKDLTVLDPCMGSGHFLVFALPILAAFRRAEEGLSETDAADAVLRDNLFGLEIDPRCTQIAAFNLAFAAWRRTGFHALPQLNLACSGLAIGVTKAEWLRRADQAVAAADPEAKHDLLGVEDNLLTHGLEERVRNGLDALYDLFAKAPWLGSLIDPRRAGADIFREGFDKLEPLLASILTTTDTHEAREMAVVAHGMAKAAELLSSQYWLVVTNVPYLKRGHQENIIQEYCLSHYSKSKGNLACAMFEKCMSFCKQSGHASVVIINELLSSKGYNAFRQDLLKNYTWKSVIRLGPGAFEAIQGEVVNVSLVSATSHKPDESNKFVAINATDAKTPDQKAFHIRTGSTLSLGQAKQVGNPDSRIVLEILEEQPLLSKYLDFGKGSVTGDKPHYHRYFWEIDCLTKKMVPWLNSPTPDDLWSGRSTVCIVPLDDQRLQQERGLGIRGHSLWGRKGIAVSKMGAFTPIIYAGEVFDSNIGALSADDVEIELATLCYIESKEYGKQLRKIDQAIKITSATLTKVPFDLKRWQAVAAQRYPGDLPRPSSNDPSQWLFEGNPVGAMAPLHVAAARLLGYRWPRQTGSNFMDCPAVGPDGLESHADDDGIVGLTALKGEAPAEQRLNALLANAFGADWSATKLAGLLSKAGFAGKSLGDWLRDGFFEQQCALFEQRPFIWHIWDGRRDGFHALVNYHRLAAPNNEGHRMLEKLIYSYLGDWIDRQRADQSVGVEGADARLAHAEHLRVELIKILEGEPPYDIFVRWKPLCQQPIGWDPDTNDGVRINIRPFMTACPLGTRAKNTCILRSPPKIKWTKDRGKEPMQDKEPMRDREDYPWFWGWDEAEQDFAGGDNFDSNRWNNLHYSNSAKQDARARQLAKVEGKT